MEEAAEVLEVSPRTVRREWETRIPIGRLQRPEELADLVAFLRALTGVQREMTIE